MKFYWLVAFVICTSGLRVGQAEAQIKPFKISGEGIAPDGLSLPGDDPRSHWIVGEAIHLGRHYGEGSVQTFTAIPGPEAGQITGEFGSGSAFTFVGANGDELVKVLSAWAQAPRRSH
jgi:hypothetical protein